MGNPGQIGSELQQIVIHRQSKLAENVTYVILQLRTYVFGLFTFLHEQDYTQNLIQACRLENSRRKKL